MYHRDSKKLQETVNYLQGWGNKVKRFKLLKRRNLEEVPYGAETQTSEDGFVARLVLEFGRGALPSVSHL